MEQRIGKFLWRQKTELGFWGKWGVMANGVEFLLRTMKMFKADSDNGYTVMTTKTTESHTLNGWTVRCVNYILTKQKKRVLEEREDAWVAPKITLPYSNVGMHKIKPRCLQTQVRALGPDAQMLRVVLGKEPGGPLALMGVLPPL